MKRLFGIGILTLALWLVTPFVWVERAVTGGRKFEPFERVLAGISVLGMVWTSVLMLFYVPHFAELAQHMQLELPRISESLLYGTGFHWSLATVAVLTAIAMRVKMSGRARKAILVATGFGGMLLAQFARVALVMPFFESGCPHG